MATTTTNFGWTIPQSTDLVKDGATAISTLGSGIDTSMAQLKGGTTGQMLTKTSGTDMAFTWVTPNPGDITGVTAGTGISGGGTSGDVTVTNSMATALTTKGDITPATASGAFARLGVGSNNQVLMADSAQATGLKYANEATATLTAKGDVLTATAANVLARLAVGTNGQVLKADSTAATGLAWGSATPSFTGWSISKATANSVSTATTTKCTFDTETLDTNNFHDNVTNPTRVTIPAGLAGKYLVFGQGTYGSNGTGTRENAILKNNTTSYGLTSFPTSTITGNSLSLWSFAIIDLAVSDYLEFTVWQSSGGSLSVYGSLFGIYLGA